MNQYTEISGIAKKEPAKSAFQGASYAKLAKSAIMGTIAGVFSSVVLMIIFAFIINAVFGDPEGVLNIFTGAAVSVGAAIGGYYASKINGSKGFVSGFTTGIIICFVLLSVMIFNGKTPDNTKNTDIIFKFIIILCQIIFACAGGIFAVNSHKSKKSVKTYPINKKK